MNEGHIDLLVPPRYVKLVKTALEHQSLLDKGQKIIAAAASEVGKDADPRMRIPTKMTDTHKLDGCVSKEDTLDRRKEAILKELGLEGLDDDVGIEIARRLRSVGSTRQGPLSKGLEQSLNKLPQGLLEALELSTTQLVDAVPTTYSIYKPMLLLPPSAFSSDPWEKLFNECAIDSEMLQPIWKSVGQTTDTTHIAINAGIPLSDTSVSMDSSEQDPIACKENILRSPIRLIPVYGDFGPHPSPFHRQFPAREDFDAAFWASTTQNGIHQVWAPLYTMFSRGNIREKTRLLALPSFQSSSSQSNRGCTAVDLYAGIGYFAFSYRKAGVQKTLCWELNPWSVEGLRRGAARNGWTASISSASPKTSEEWVQLVANDKDVDFLIFQQSNEEALAAISQISRKAVPSIPPIRHVNCGYLPSSHLSWRTAVNAIDVELGGWIHAHENVGSLDIQTRKGQVVDEMQGYLNDMKARTERLSKNRIVKCDHVEKVKTYAPGVVHVVFDVWVGGTKDDDTAMSA